MTLNQNSLLAADCRGRPMRARLLRSTSAITGIAVLGCILAAPPVAAQTVQDSGGGPPIQTSSTPVPPARTVADAQTAAGGVPDIIITAERRSTSLQKTPIAVTALSGDVLAQKQIFALRDVQSLVPSLKIGEAQGVAQFTIRGIGSSAILGGSEGAVAVNLNEVYVSRPVAQLTGLFDVSAIEVLRGPQARFMDATRRQDLSTSPRRARPMRWKGSVG